jgi:hypothetical protein
VDAYICEECLTDFKLHLNASWPVLFNFGPDRPSKSCIVCGQVRARLGPRLIRNSSLLFRSPCVRGNRPSVNSGTPPVPRILALGDLDRFRHCYGRAARRFGSAHGLFAGPNLLCALSLRCGGFGLKPPNRGLGCTLGQTGLIGGWIVLDPCSLRSGGGHSHGSRRKIIRGSRGLTGNILSGPQGRLSRNSLCRS